MAIHRVTFDENDVRKILEPDSVGKRLKRAVVRLLKGGIYLAILYGIFFAVLNSSAYWIRISYAVKDKPAVIPTPEQVKPVPIENVPDFAPEIIIPKISIQAPVILNVLPDESLTQLDNGVIQYADTALPGQIGNTVLVGHSSDYPWKKTNYKNIFALLDKLAVGDQIVLPYKTQRYVYEVIESKVVKPDELRVLAKTSQPRLTLITCYPVGTTQKRLVVTAKLASGQVIGEQINEPLLEALPKAR